MTAHLNTAKPFNIDGPDRRCSRCPAEASFFQSQGRHHVTGLPIIVGRWCRQCLPDGFMPVRPARAA